MVDDGLNASILVADDDPLVCDLLRIRLQAAGFSVVNVVTDGRSAIEAVASMRPDILLLDISMPDLDGLEVLNVVKATSPVTQVLMLTARENPDYVARAIAMGAAGYIVKRPAAIESLSETIRLALEGDAVVVDQTLLREAALRTSHSNGSAEPEIPPSLAALTPQETEVLKLIAGGLTNEEIGASLHVSYNTVKSHVSSIYDKLQVSDRTQAAIFALRQGIGPKE